MQPPDAVTAQPGHDEVGLGGVHVEAQLAQTPDQRPAGALDARHVPLHPLHIFQGRRRRRQAQAAQVVGVLHLHQAAHDVLAAESQADAHAGQREGLGEGAQYHQVGKALDQRDGAFVTVGEVDVGLVHHQQARHRTRQAGDLAHRLQGPGRGVGVAQDGDLARLEVERRRYGEVVRIGNGRALAALDGNERLVQRVGGHRIGHAVALTHVATHQDGQQLVRAIARHDILRPDVVEGGRALSQLQGHGIGIEAQRGGDLLAHRGQHPGRRGIGILVGVELDKISLLGLLPGRVTLQIFDVFPEDGLHPEILASPCEHCKFIPDLIREPGGAGGMAASRPLTRGRSEASVRGQGINFTRVTVRPTIPTAMSQRCR